MCNGFVMVIKLKPDVEEQLIGSIRRYWQQEEDEDLGNLRAGLLLKFMLQELGPSVYNQAIQDAQDYMQEKAAEVELSCYAEEFTYWSGRKKK